MLNFLRRKTPVPEPALTADEELALEQELAIQNVKDAIDVINLNMPKLPRGISPWMDWSDIPHGPPRLRLKQRRWDRDTILHG